MKIGIPSNGKDLTSSFAGVFGRCPFFAIIDSNNLELITVFPNEAQNAAGGAGIQASQLLVNQNVEIVIAPQMGPNAWNVLQAANVKIYTGINGTIKQNAEAFLAGKLTETSMASGRGMGRGMGMGMGRGMGRGQGRGRGNY